MKDASLLRRLAITVAVAAAAATCALPASASRPSTTHGHPSAAAVAAWSASYRAKEKAYRQQLAARPSAAAVQAWSDDYRAMEDVYQQQQLARAEHEAAAFHVGDAVIGGGVVLTLVALAAAGFIALRSRRLADATSS